MPPAYPLEEVRRLAGLGPPRVHLGKRNAIDMVAGALTLKPEDAGAYILALIGRLTEDNYAHTKTDHPPPADVYGLPDGGRGWYIKFAIQRGRLLVISCHVPGEPLRTRSGTITYRG